MQAASYPKKASCTGEAPKRVVFSVTTHGKRLESMKPMLDSVLAQTRRPDAVYLSVGPDVKKLPAWMEWMQKQPGHVLKVLREPKDLGPGMKLLGGLREELAAGHKDTLLVYGDDDQVYGSDLLRLHIERHRCDTSGKRTAFGPRFIRAGKPEIGVLEATGSISVITGAVPSEVFNIGDTKDECKFSDDFFISRALQKSGVKLEAMGECHMNWETGKMAKKCVRGGLDGIAQMDPLSQLHLQHSGQSVFKSFDGDWRSQLERYKDCGEILDATDRVSFVETHLGTHSAAHLGKHSAAHSGNHSAGLLATTWDPGFMPVHLASLHPTDAYNITGFGSRNDGNHPYMDVGRHFRRTNSHLYIWIRWLIPLGIILWIAALGIIYLNLHSNWKAFFGKALFG